MGNCSFCAKKNPAIPIYRNIPAEGQPDPKEGESLIYHHPLSVKNKTIWHPNRTLQKIILDRFEQSPNEEFLGIRHRDTSGKLDNKFTFLTYAQVKETAQQLGSGLIHLDLVPELCEFED